MRGTRQPSCNVVIPVLHCGRVWELFAAVIALPITTVRGGAVTEYVEIPKQKTQ